MKTKQNYPFTFIIYIILLIASIVAVCIASSYNKAHSEDPPQEFEAFDDGWVNIKTNEPADFSEILDNITIKKNLGVVIKDKTLNFRAKNINLIVSCQGEILAEYNVKDNEYQGKTPGTYFVSVPIYKEYSNSDIIISIFCPYKNDTTCNIKNMYIGSGRDITLNLVRKNFFNFFVCILISSLGIICIIASIAFRKYEKNGNSLTYLGLFALVGGVWSATETKFLQLLEYDSGVIHLVTGLTLMLIVIPLFLFFKSRLASEHKVPIFIVSGFSIINYLVCFCLHFLKIKDFHETIIFTHFSIILGAAITLFFALKVAMNSHFKDISFLGLCGIAILSVIDVYLYYKQIINDSSTFTRLGILIYIAALSVQIMNEYVKIYNNNLRIEMVSKMAYTDVLTNINNRTAFEEEKNNFVLPPQETRLIAIFDLNNLKHINDTYGHSTGDEAIIEASEFLSEAFGKYGKCYRLGGDEFVFLSNFSMSSDKCQDVINSMFSQLNKRNINSNKKYKLIIATGYEIIDANRNFESAFENADKNMYKNKKFLKETMKSS